MNKQCYVCGKPLTLISYAFLKDTYHIQCMGCHMSGPIAKSANIAWNNWDLIKICIIEEEHNVNNIKPKIAPGFLMEGVC